jgi:hypothetical protein
MLYRSSMARVRWPLIRMATSSGTPARMRLRTAVRRRSWKCRRGTPALAQAVSDNLSIRQMGFPLRWWKDQAGHLNPAQQGREQPGCLTTLDDVQQLTLDGDEPTEAVLG